VSSRDHVGEGFREILKARARAPQRLGPLVPSCANGRWGRSSRATGSILSDEATPAQTAGFLLVGRAVGDGHAELAAYARVARSSGR
jgi:anthranilate phosphoribosyltransferase